MNNAEKQPNNKRSRTTGKLELRKLWSVPKADFIYALFVGDEEWAKKTAEHFEIEFPKDEWKGESKEENKESK